MRREGKVRQGRTGQCKTDRQGPREIDKGMDGQRDAWTDRYKSHQENTEPDLRRS